MFASLATLIIAAGVVAFLATILGLYKLMNAYRLKAKQAGYSTLGSYMRAAPKTDGEKKDAVDLMLRGLVLCVVGLVFPPLILVGIFPLFYGGRKMAYSSMGLGLMEDMDQSEL